MGLKFNPFSGNFDFTGSGGGGDSYIDGEVATYADLPLDGTAAINTAWLVREASGAWLLARKPAGIYIRTATAGVSRDADYTYAGILPDVFNDANFLLYDNGDSTKNLAFQLSGISTGQTRTLTVPNASGRIQVEGQPIGNTTAAAGSFTTLSATGIVTGSNATTSPPTTIDQAKGLQFSSLGGTFGSTAGIYGSHTGTSTLGIGIANDSAGILTQVAAFTSTGLSVTGGTITASAPALDLAQTWNNSGVTFTGLRFNATDTASAAASNLAEFQVGGTGVAQIRKDGSYRIVGGGDRTIISTAGLSLTAAAGGSWLQVSSTVATNGSYRSFGNLVLLSSVAGGTDPVVLDRDGAGIFAQRNGTNAQTFRLYNTFTSTTNFERLNIIAQSAGSVIIGTEKGSAGGTARALEFRTDGTTRLTLGAAGGFTLADAQDIAVGTTTGTKIGTSTSQKIGFFNATPVVQQAAVADATDAASTQARLNDLLARLRTLGLIAT